MFATSLNLLPGGQLDGGHIIFSLSPRNHKRISNATILALIPLTVYCWAGWFVLGRAVTAERNAASGSFGVAGNYKRPPLVSVGRFGDADSDSCSSADQTVFSYRCAATLANRALDLTPTPGRQRNFYLPATAVTATAAVESSTAAMSATIPSSARSATTREPLLPFHPPPLRESPPNNCRRKL